jgi:hypothetical protein
MRTIMQHPLEWTMKRMPGLLPIYKPIATAQQTDSTFSEVSLAADRLQDEAVVLTQHTSVTGKPLEQYDAVNKRRSRRTGCTRARRRFKDCPRSRWMIWKSLKPSLVLVDTARVYFGDECGGKAALEQHQREKPKRNRPTRYRPSRSNPLLNLIQRRVQQKNHLPPDILDAVVSQYLDVLPIVDQSIAFVEMVGYSP